MADFAELIQQAFPDTVFGEEQIAALKAAVQECVRSDEAGEYEEDSMMDEEEGTMDASNLAGLLGE